MAKNIYTECLQKGFTNKLNIPHLLSPKVNLNIPMKIQGVNGKYIVFDIF